MTQTQKRTAIFSDRFEFVTGYDDTTVTGSFFIDDITHFYGDPFMEKRTIIHFKSGARLIIKMDIDKFNEWIAYKTEIYKITDKGMIRYYSEDVIS